MRHLHPLLLTPLFVLLLLPGCSQMVAGDDDDDSVTDDDDSAVGDDDTTPQPLEVHEGESIQDAIDLAAEGQVVRVFVGTYYEALEASYDGIQLQGMVDGDERPVLDGEHTRDNGVSGTSNGFRISGFEVRNYLQNGVWITGSDEVIFSDMVATDTGRYGLYASQCTHVLVERSVISVSADAGVYIGQGENALVQQNEVFDSVAGVECENTVSCEVADNYIHDNTSGILNILLPGLPRKDNQLSSIHGNTVENNNLPNFANPADFVSNVPVGGGIILFGGDEAQVYENTVSGNDSFGIGLFSLYVLFTTEELKADPKIDPWTDTNTVTGNTVTGNGANPAPLLVDFGITGADLLWDAMGDDNCWSDNVFDTFYNLTGEDLPSCP